MYYYRISKYNPKFRNTEGYYLKDEWTDYSEIGKIYNQQVFTFDDYKVVEDAYIYALERILKYLGKTLLEVDYIEKYGPPKKIDELSMFLVYQNLVDGSIVSKGDTRDVFKLVLRNNISCRLTSEDLTLYTGYDLYFYIVSNSPLLCFSNIFAKKGIYIEMVVSGYLDWILDGNFEYFTIEKKDTIDRIITNLIKCLKSSDKYIYVCIMSGLLAEDDIVEILETIKEKYSIKFAERLAFEFDTRRFG